MRQAIAFWWYGLTPGGRRDAIHYWLRGLIIRPVSTEDRCIMGAPVDDMVWCPRRAENGELWCRRHP